MKLIFNLYCTFLISLSSYGKNETIYITSGEYPPYSSESLKHTGFAHHVISEAFSREGYKTVFLYYPWARSYKEGASGKYHASGYWMCTQKHRKDFYCGGAIYNTEFVFFHLKTTGFKEWNALEDLKTYKIGATRGYAYTAEFWEAQKNNTLKVVVNNTDDLGFKMLLRQRIDLFVMSTIPGYTLLYKKYSPSVVSLITHNHKPLVSNTIHLLFPKKRPDAQQLLKVFNKGLQSLKTDGTYEKYYSLLLEGYYEKQ